MSISRGGGSSTLGAKASKIVNVLFGGTKVSYKKRKISNADANADADADIDAPPAKKR
jgi:hypothetical protein